MKTVSIQVSDFPGVALFSMMAAISEWPILLVLILEGGEFMYDLKPVS